MGRFAGTCLVALVLMALSGCADNSMVLKGQVDQYRNQQLALANQQQQLQGRASALDRDNEELGSLLAQARQQTKLAEDHVRALQQELQSATSQLAEARSSQRSSDQKVQALTASLRQQGSVTIRPNNSLTQTLPAINLPDVHVRRDGDVIRVELPGSQLFESGSTQLRPGADGLIVRAASELLSVYPSQMMGIEGHTDSDALTSSRWRNNHELSVARAIVVYEVLTRNTRLQPGQLFIVGHGPNHPVASNATLDGKQRNRRVELVVYPETMK